MSDELNISEEIKRIDSKRMNLKAQDLNEDEITLVLNIGLSFNPKSKRWDGNYIERKDIAYFVNKEGKLALPLGEVASVDMDNLGLKSLHNCPTFVKYDFNINNNELESLEDCPTHIGGNFNCSNNKLKTLNGLGASISVAVFNCDNNLLENLEGCPGIREELNANDNPLTSLKGMPLALEHVHSNGSSSSPVKYDDFVLNAKKTRLTNYAYMTIHNFNVTSLYKISDIEKYFVTDKNIRKPKDSNNFKMDDLVRGQYTPSMTEQEYYLSLADFIVKAERESHAEEIWWHKDVLPNIKNLFSSMKAVSKFNL